MAELNPLSMNAVPSGRSSVSMKGGKQVINLMSLPSDIQGFMAVFDQNNDGVIEVEELTACARSHMQLNHHHSQLKKFGMIVGTLLLMSVLATFGLSFAVYELAKDTRLDEQDVMRSVIDGQIVQTGNYDMSVSDDILMNRQSGTPLKVAEGLAQIKTEDIHSGLPDAFFREFREFSVSHELSSVHFNINGFTRNSNGQTDADKTTITLYTNMGKILLTGYDWDVDEEAHKVMIDVGLGHMVEESGEGRRLLFFVAAAEGVLAGAVGAWGGLIICGATMGVGCVVGGAALAVGGVVALHNG